MNTDLLMSGGVAAGSVLAGGGISILTVEARRGRRLASSVLAQRWLSWLVLTPLWLLASASPWGRAVVLTGAAVAGIREYGRLRPQLQRSDRAMLVSVATVVIPVTLLAGVTTFIAVAVLGASLRSPFVIPGRRRRTGTDR